MPRPRRARGRQSAVRRTGTSTQHRGDARVQCVLNLLWADEVNMSIDAAGRDNLALACDDFSTGADDDVDSRLHVGVAGFADPRNEPITDPDVRLDDSPVIEDDGIRDDRIHGPFGAGALGLSHPVTDDL